MRHFDREIEHLKELLLRMGAMVEDQINESIQALLERDTTLAQRVIDSDTAIDQMELDIDQHTIELIEYGPTDVIFTNPHEERTEAYVTGRFG